jgi:predicted dithiol-disulfide oxidoreductase (DUF899 family)
MTTEAGSDFKSRPVVSHGDWLAARTALMAREKEFTRLRDELSRQRRELPWERVEKSYGFDGPAGRETLADLFEDRSQLIVYHFMFPADWDEGCLHCSFWADNFNGIDVHLEHRDTSFVAISRAPLAKIQAFNRRMGWTFKWLSSADTDFNNDFQVSFTPEEVETGATVYNYSTSPPAVTEMQGVSVFYKDAQEAIFHTYSCYSRGIDMLNGAYHYLDLTPKGRDEDPENTQGWLRHHDRYEEPAS